MPRYLVQRRLGPITDADLDAAAEHATAVRAAQFPEIAWEHSHVVRAPDGGRVGYCIYAAPSAQHVRDHAAASGIPADAVEEIERDLVPAPEEAVR